jgi:hypothetical protein
LIRRKITPIAHKIAIAFTTHIINFLHCVTFSCDAHQVLIITQPTIITPKQTTKITVINIFVSHHIKIGKAVDSLIFDLGFCELSSMQLPIKGTLVFNFIPQQLPVMFGSQTHLSCTHE